MNLLRVEQLSMTYGHDPVLDHVRFQLEEGEILGIVGESGGGKSSIARSILGLIDPPGKILEGSIHLDGRELTRLSEKEMAQIRRREVSFLMQNPMSAFNPIHSIERHLTDAIRMKKNVTRQAAREEMLDLLTQVGIEDPQRVCHYLPHQFSGGMLQRAAIAMAVCGPPKLMIADEPTASLDSNIQKQILGLLRSTVQKRKMALLLITHSLSVVAQLCDRVLVLRNGVIVEEGAVRRVMEHPEHPYTQMLLDALLRIGD